MNPKTSERVLKEAFIKRKVAHRFNLNESSVAVLWNDVSVQVYQRQEWHHVGYHSDFYDKGINHPLWGNGMEADNLVFDVVSDECGVTKEAIRLSLKTPVDIFVEGQWQFIGYLEDWIDDYKDPGFIDEPWTYSNDFTEEIEPFAHP